MRTGHVYGGWFYVHQLQHRRADDLDTAAKLGDTPASMVREDAPPSVLSRLLDPIGRCLTPEGAQRLVAIQVDQAAEARLEELAEKCTEGQLSADERTEYETYVQALEFIAVLQAKARSLLTNGHV